jgi:hypothetical protein
MVDGTIQTKFLTDVGDTRLVPEKDWPEGLCPSARGEGWVRVDADEDEQGWKFAEFEREHFCVD